MKDSLFFSSLRSFLIALCATIGIVFALLLTVIGLAILFSEEKSFPSQVKIRPDAQGNRKELSSSVPVLLEIHFNGVIGEEDLTAGKIEEILLVSREDEFKPNRVKGILLVVDTPGGSANDADLIYNYLVQYKKRFNVPIYTYVSGLCASGGMYIASASDKIFATDSSLIGSVGVVSWPPFFNVKQVMEKVGVEALTLSAGKGKDDLNPFRTWKEGEGKTRQELIDFLYERFIDIVSQGRPKLNKEKLKEYGARVFPAPSAKELGYIDDYGVMQSYAIKELAIASGIKEGDQYQVVRFETKNWWKKWMEERFPLFSGKIRHEISLSKELQVQSIPSFSYLYAPGI